ncbi:hypothetical protein [Pseudomonas sp. MWU12-2037]|uniref:hypothetical protein n=1 Tax=Pseudomonas sp. MWU12-2037 TaxID=2928690 RepID=UPI00200C6469|nr:hypothetical protein [Pseudomonas sp. MWU12-2037]
MANKKTPLHPPLVQDAEDGKLSYAQLSGGPATVLVPAIYSIEVGSIIDLHFGTYHTLHAVSAGEIGLPLMFLIPNDAVKNDIGKTVAVGYSVTLPSGNEAVSPKVDIKVVT